MTKAESIATLDPYLDVLVISKEPNGIDARTDHRRIAVITPEGCLRINLHDWQMLDDQGARQLARFIDYWFGEEGQQ